jgi:hypothetical protein
MIPAPPRAVSSAAHAWDIMREDVTRRQHRMTPGFNVQRQKDLLALNYEALQSGNAGYYFHARVDLEIRDTKERAQALYDACCEVWEIHGQQRNRAFYRAVFDNCLQGLFGTRRATIIAELQLRDVRMRTPGNSSAAIGSLTQKMSQLASDWKIRLDIETRDSETRERVKRELAALRPTTPVVLTSHTPIPPSPSDGMTPVKKRVPKKLTKSETNRRAVIFGAIQAKDIGLKYCKTLVGQKLAVPEDWIQDGCPKTYTDAYRAGQPWRKRIQDEKSRYKKKYDETPAAEREKLLQDSSQLAALVRDV